MSDRLLVVTDVDNTLYDWVSLWAGAFDAMIRTLADKTDRGAEQWLTAAHAVHVRRSATECPSLLCDMASSATWPAGIDPSRVLPAAAAAYRGYWDHHLTTYPGVREALTHLTERGHVVVAYTEGDVSIAANRIARLGLAGVIRRVFGRAPLPAPAQPAWCTVGSSHTCPIAVDFIPRDDNKPNPTGLRTIIAHCDSTPIQSVYVGDNLWKDVLMAQALGTRAFWARYGTARDPAHMALLARVAPWRPEHVAAERRATADTVHPDAVLDDPRDLPAVVAKRALAAAAS
jgi:phosphoglycolate phosphatase